MRTLAPADSFIRDLNKFLKRHPDLSNQIEKIFDLLEKDVHNATLHSHKLHGALSNSYSCRINHQYRIIFSFDKNDVYLKYIGSHNDVY